jgi:hypothetical protein
MLEVNMSSVSDVGVEEVRFIRFKKTTNEIKVSNGDFEWLKYLPFFVKLLFCWRMLFERNIFTPEEIGLDRRLL